MTVLVRFLAVYGMWVYHVRTCSSLRSLLGYTGVFVGFFSIAYF